ncbi:DrmB family protein [Bradyrhizobium japonicum]|uniref:DrmB family protein n=1 Tax=Bradyrhizobium japonicum TaxID=375 RepID=UPI003518CC83
MADDKVRLGQVIGVFGPGAMLDLPERSVLVQGLDQWEMFGAGTFKIIEEPRLARLLHQRLKDDGRLVADRAPELRTPPIDPGDPKRPSPGIKATVFPRWFACDAVAGDHPNRRRLVRFQDLEPPKRLEHKADDGKRRKASPIRFVCGCENGHLQDIDWRRTVHQGFRGRDGDGASGPCREQMWQEDAGTSADPRDIRIVCDCGASLSLEELFQRGRLGPCPGERPWIGDRDPNPCNASEGLRLLTRSAINAYFPQVARVVSLPQRVDDLARQIETFWSVLEGCGSADDIKAARRFNPALRASLAAYSDEAIFNRLQSMHNAGTQVDAAEDPRIAEFQLLASGDALIGSDSPDANLHAETLDRALWDPDEDAVATGIKSLVAVHRLREVACLYGFTRFEPAPLATDELEDVGLAVEGAPLAQMPDWLPAVEQFGEGFFVQFAAEALQDWLVRPSLLARATQLQGGVTAWINQKRARGEKVSENSVHERARPEYIFAHTLAHALMSEVAIDCGYPASSLKERLYVLPRLPGQPIQCGILIYTASAGNQGTLGGLVEVTRRFVRLLKSALERQRLCSGDPVCADHDPTVAYDDRALHGAACHGCLLVAETSCEARNLFLDRALIVDTMGETRASFFG